MYWTRHGIQSKPLHRIKLVWLAIGDLTCIDQDFVIERYPVCLLALLCAQDTAIPEKFVLQNICAVLFFDLSPKASNCIFAKLQLPTTKIPATIFVSAVFATVLGYLFMNHHH